MWTYFNKTRFSRCNAAVVPQSHVKSIEIKCKTITILFNISISLNFSRCLSLEKRSDKNSVTLREREDNYTKKKKILHLYSTELPFKEVPQQEVFEINFNVSIIKLNFQQFKYFVERFLYSPLCQISNILDGVIISFKNTVFSMLLYFRYNELLLTQINVSLFASTL